MANSLAALEKHTKLVADVSAQVRRFHESKTPFRIYHGSTNSTRPVARNRASIVDVSALNNVLSLNTTARIISVEPNVPMDALVKATLPHGLIPPVIPEFPGITAGGGFAGTAGESSSFRYGFLDATVVKLEAVLGDGEVREVVRDGEDKQLFEALAGTLGTIGVVTRLDIILVEAKEFVELTYHRVGGFQQLLDTIKSNIPVEAGNDFLDSIMFSPTKGAVITGRFVDSTNGHRITTFTKRRDPWYYVHVEKSINKAAPAKEKVKTVTKTNGSASDSTSSTPILFTATDYVPLTDYLFRYDRGGFWVGRYAFDYFSLPFIKPIRTIMDTYLHTRAMYSALHSSNQQQLYIVEDLAVPFERVVPFLEYLNSDFNIYPLWVCPLKFQPTGLHIKHFPEDTDLLMNVGVWGPRPPGFASYEEANIALEKKIRELDGVKWLYAQMFYQEEEFWDLYDREKYVELRRKFKAEGLPDVFDKIKQPEKTVQPRGSVGERAKQKLIGFWVFPGLYGLYKTWRGKDYILNAR